MNQRTQTRDRQNDDWRARRDEENKQALMTVQPPRLPMPADAEKTFGLVPAQWKTLTDAIFPSARSVDGVMLALAYAKSRNLDVFKRVVHVVPMYSSALGREVETVWPGIAELRTTATRTGQWAGIDEVVFGPTVKKAFHDKRVSQGRNGGSDYTTEERCEEFDFPAWAQLTVYKMVDGQRVKFVGPKVIFEETFSGVKGLHVPNAMWRKRPFGQLEKCAEAAALRRAFPEELGNEYTADEMEGKTWEHHVVEGEYAVVSETDAGGKPDGADGQAQRTDNPQSDRDFVDMLKEGFGKARTVAEVQKAESYYAEDIPALSEDHQAEVQRAIDEALVRLNEANDHKDPAPSDDEPDPADIAAYVAAVEERLAGVATMIDLNSLESGERASFEHLPADVRLELQEKIDARKEELRSAASGSPAADLADDAGAGGKEK